MPVAILENRQVTPVLGGGNHPEAAAPRTVQNPLRLLILCDVREDLLLATRVGLTRLSESRVDAEAETPPLASRQTIKESTRVTDEHSPIRRITGFLNEVRRIRDNRARDVERTRGTSLASGSTPNGRWTVQPPENPGSSGRIEHTRREAVHYSSVQHLPAAHELFRPATVRIQVDACEEH